MQSAAPSRIVVVGAGMAGVSLGYELAREHHVVVLEAEALPAQHSTGRSAALFFAGYGPPAVQEVSRASRPLFDELQQSLATPNLLRPRGALLVATEAGAAAALDTGMRERGLQPLSRTACAELCPVLDASQILCAGYDSTACDIDVLALHDGYVRGLRTRGGELVYRAAFAGADRTASGWRVTAVDGQAWDCDVIVNAAGAWGDQVWAALGVHGHGLVPRRRTVAVARTSARVGAAWPIVGDAAEAWYFRPEGAGVLVSPSDESPSVPCDESADPLDVARALERVNGITSLALRSVTAAWAGQRTFAPDGLPVVGPHAEDDSLFAFLGQGGYGIQIAPALARAAARLLRDGTDPAQDFPLSPFSPRREQARTPATWRRDREGAA